MKRLTKTASAFLVGVGLLLAPAVIALPASAAPATAVQQNGPDLYADGWTTLSSACSTTPFSTDYYIAIVVLDETAGNKVTIELIDGKKHTTVKTAHPKDTNGTAITFPNPRRLPFQATMHHKNGKTQVSERYTPDAATKPATPAKKKVAAKKSKITGWGNVKKQATSYPMTRKVTVTNPDGRKFKVQQKIKGKWKTIQSTTLNKKSKQTVKVKIKSPAKKTGKHTYRVVMGKSSHFSKNTYKNATFTSTKAKQSVKVKVKSKGKKKSTVKVASSKKVKSKVYLQKKVGKKYRTVAKKTSSKANATFTVNKKSKKMGKGKYRVVVKSSYGVTTKAYKSFRVK